MWWTLIAGAWATETPSFDAPAIELGAGLPLYTQRGAAQLSGRAIWGWTAAELNLSLDPNTDLRPTRIDGFSLDQDWAVKGWVDLSPPAPGRSGFHAAPHLYLGALRWRGQLISGASRGQSQGAFDAGGTWSWAPAAGVGIDVGYQRISLRARAELSRRSLGGAHQLHQGAGVDLLVKL